MLAPQSAHTVIETIWRLRMSKSVLVGVDEHDRARDAVALGAALAELPTDLVNG